MLKSQSSGPNHFSSASDARRSFEGPPACNRHLLACYSAPAKSESSRERFRKAHSSRVARRKLPSTQRCRPSRSTRKCPLRPTSSECRAHRRKFRSEEHTSELQSRGHLVCRLLLEKKKTK